MTQSLSHITVLDLSRIPAGPWAGQLLADLGPRSSRSSGQEPETTRGPSGRPSGAGAVYYLCANRNKKSVTLDISTTDGQRIVRELASTSDIVLENFKAGGLKAYGLDHEPLLVI
jgi:crotonobetainyl-CoA:carnitine CoA-transferase CaiB-like acyl-CoA transferase